MEIKLTVEDLKEYRNKQDKICYEFMLELSNSQCVGGFMEQIGDGWKTEYCYQNGDYEKFFSDYAKNLEQAIDFVNDTLIDEYEEMGYMQRSS